MMVTLGIYMRRWQRLLRRWLLDPRFHALAQGALYIGAGFLASAVSLAQNPQPVALGLVCALSGWSAVLTAMGGMLGYGILWGSAGVQGILWLCAGVLAAVILGGSRLSSSHFLLMPAVACAITAVMGLVFRMWFGDQTPVLLYLLRVAVAGAGAGLFSAALSRRDPVVDWLLCGVAVLALAQLRPVPYLGLGFLAAGALTVKGAFPAVALGGLALDLAGITPVPMTAAVCLGYFLRMLPIPKRVRFLAPAAACLLTMGLCALWDPEPLPGLLLGGILSHWLPGNSGITHRRGETGYAQVRLEMVSSVLRQTQQLLLDVEEFPVDEEALMARAAEKACSGCPCRKNCREEPANMPTALLHKPLGNGADLPLSCRKAGRLLQELRRSQEQLRSIRADRDRRQEYREAVGQQYRFLSDYLQEVSDSLPQRTEPARQLYRPEVAVCSSSREKTSGDRCLWFAGVECRYYILLCDGMGTGAEAGRDGKTAGNLLKKLLSCGFPPEYALRSINSLCALQGRAGAVTVDLAELRLDTGKVSIYKWGAAPSYVLSHGESVKIGTAAPPPGLSVTDGRETVERLSLRRGETLVLLSDGAGGEGALQSAVSLPGASPGELAARILECSQTGASDDATVAVVRLNSLSAST